MHVLGISQGLIGSLVGLEMDENWASILLCCYGIYRNLRIPKYVVRPRCLYLKDIVGGLVCRE